MNDTQRGLLWIAGSAGIAAAGVGAARRCYKSHLKEKETTNTVKVLCQGGTYNYKEAFSYFAKCKMNVSVILDTNWTQNGKYILLCDVVSRIPRDVTHVIETLDLNVDRLRENTMVVAMHISEGGQHDEVSDVIGNAEDPLHALQMRNVYYSGNFATKCSENDRAKQDIQSFLG